MTATDTGKAILQAIIDEPREDVHRLAFADWCEENGQEERGEFIRAQCEIARLEKILATEPSPASGCTGLTASWCPECGDCCCRDRSQRMNDPCCPLHAPTSRHVNDDDIRLVLEELKRRERSIWPRGVFDAKEWAFLGNSYEASIDPMCEQKCRARILYQRGFPVMARMPIHQWMDRGEKILAAHPVVRVEVTERSPSFNGNEYHWHCGYTDESPHSSDLPLKVFRAMGRSRGECYITTTEEEAVGALSDALIRIRKPRRG